MVALLRMPGERGSRERARDQKRKINKTPRTFSLSCASVLKSGRQQVFLAPFCGSSPQFGWPSKNPGDKIRLFDELHRQGHRFRQAVLSGLPVVGRSQRVEASALHRSFVSLSDCVGKTQRRITMRSFIYASTAMSVVTGRQVRTVMAGMNPLRTEDPALPRLDGGSALEWPRCRIGIRSRCLRATRLSSCRPQPQCHGESKRQKHWRAVQSGGAVRSAVGA